MNQLLNGLCVLNTRPQGQAEALSTSIHNAGGVSIKLPTIEIEETSDWLNSLPDLNQVHQAIFISANAVTACFKSLQKAGIDWPSTIKTIAIGKSTATMLGKFKIPTQFIPEIAESEHLLALETLQQPQKQFILLVKGRDGRPLIEKTLLDKGAHVTVLNVYKRIKPKINHQFIETIWHDDLVDIILLLSEQSMHNLFELFGKKAHHWLRSKTYLVISERLAQSALSLGIEHIIHSPPDQMLKALCDYTKKD